MGLPGDQWAVSDHGYPHWTCYQPMEWHPSLTSDLPRAVILHCLLVVKALISVFSSGEVLPLSTLLPSMSYMYVCVCIYTHINIYMYLQLCKFPGGWLNHYSCTWSLGVHWLNQVVCLCLRARCPGLVFGSVLPSYDLTQEARWEPKPIWVQTASFKKMCLCTPVLSFSWTCFWSLHFI